MNKFDIPLGFGQYKNLNISAFGILETDYLLWALKTVRMPKLLWETLIAYLDTKLIVNTSSCIGDFALLAESDRDKLTKDKQDKSSEFYIKTSEFLQPREEPNGLYSCQKCLDKNLGYSAPTLIPEKIKCLKCNNEILVQNIELRFYFGWYKGWRFKDFETKEDKEYLSWILGNLENLNIRFRSGIAQRLKQ